jgi:hypothetical protein
MFEVVIGVIVFAGCAAVLIGITYMDHKGWL